MLRCAPVEFDQKIEVAVCSIEIAARGRAKQIEPPHVKVAAERLQFLVMGRNFVNHNGRVPVSRTWPSERSVTVSAPIYIYEAPIGLHLNEKSGGFSDIESERATGEIRING